MKSKIASKYESKRWYRVVKSLYIILFVLLLVIANLFFAALFLEDGEEYFWPFIITNAIIIFGMGILEGLFWYVVRGKWGYPNDEEPDTK